MRARTLLRLLRLTAPGDIFLYYVKIIVLIGTSAIYLTTQEKDIKILFLLAFAISAEIFTFAVNDLFDAELDSLDPGTRNPLARGEISRRATVFFVLILLAISIFLLSLLPLRSIFLGVAGYVLSFTYSWGIRAKLKPLLDLVYHGALNTFPFVMGYTLYESFDETCLLLSFVIFLAGIVPQIMQEIRDHDVDRVFGKTTVIMLGKRKSLALCLGLLLVWFLVVATVLDWLLYFPITLYGFRIPFQFIVFPPLSLFLSMPLIQGITSEVHQKDVYQRFRKRGLAVLLIVVSISAVIFTHSSTMFFYGDPDFMNYVVRLDARTFIAGTESWNVAFIRFRYLDEANHYYLILHKNGMLELTKVVASEKTFLAFVKTDLSPFDWHRFEIILEGPSIKVSVDGALYLDVPDGSISKGMVYLRSQDSAILALFIEVEVYSLQ